MKDSQVKLFLISDMSTDIQVESLFGEIGNYTLEIVSTNNITFSQKSPSIFIVLITLENSPVLEQLLTAKNIRKDRFIFLLTESSISSIIKLVRRGFIKIYEIPEEIEELKRALMWEIKGLEVNFKSKFHGLSKDEFILRTSVGSGTESIDKIKKIKELAKKRNINIIIEGEIGLNKLALARAIYNLNYDEDDTLTEFILPYSENSGYAIKVEQNGRSWYEDVKDENELQSKLLPGTIILPNINEMNLLQQKRLYGSLNTLLENQTYARKYRLIATGEEGLTDLATKGLFDEKLFYLLNTAYIDLIPLRYRQDDLQYLFEHLILTNCKKLKKEITKIEKEVFDFIYSYPWLGNIHELENAVINAITFSSSTTLSISNFTSVINKTHKDHKMIIHSTDVLPDNLLLEINFNTTSLDELNKQYVKEIIAKLNGNKTKTAEILGITRPTLQKLLN